MTSFSFHCARVLIITPACKRPIPKATVARSVTLIGTAHPAQLPLWEGSWGAKHHGLVVRPHRGAIADVWIPIGTRRCHNVGHAREALAHATARSTAGKLEKSLCQHSTKATGVSFGLTSGPLAISHANQSARRLPSNLVGFENHARQVGQPAVLQNRRFGEITA